jgi:hypothetical protein
MTWFSTLPPHLQQFIIGASGELAAEIISAAGRKAKKKFQGPEKQRALDEALNEALAAAITALELNEDEEKHYLSLFGDFLADPDVAEALSILIDPDPDENLDLDFLRNRFNDAGFDPDFLPGTDFNNVVYSIVAAFAMAAEEKEELTGLIEIQYLKLLVKKSGTLEQLAERTAAATEQTASFSEQQVATSMEIRDLVKIVAGVLQDQNGNILDAADAVREVLNQSPDRMLEVYQAAAAGIGRADRQILINRDGGITIAMDTGTTRASGPDLDPLKGVMEEIRDTLLSTSMPISDDELQFRESNYKKLIIQQLEYLKLEGLSTDVRPILLPLEKVYVHLRAVAEVPDAADDFTPEERRMLRLLEEEADEPALREARLTLDRHQRERWTQDRLERFPITEALQDSNRQGLVILGDPGSGKTTLLNFLALIFAQGPQAVQQHFQFDHRAADRLPIIAPLATYDVMLDDEANLSVSDFLGRYYDQYRSAPGLGYVFKEAMGAGRALVLLDGLDEVVEESRRKFVAERTSSFIQEANRQGNIVVLTSRIYGYRAAPLRLDLPHITVLDFRSAEIDMFSRQWCRAMATWDQGTQVTAQSELMAQENERRLLHELHSNPGVESLAVNPLMLTMLALLQRKMVTLPQRRIELYHDYVQALLMTWEENRSRGARLKRAVRIDYKAAENTLMPLALWLQENRLSGTATYQELENQLVRQFLKDLVGSDELESPPTEALSAAQERSNIFVQDMRQFSGLLIERGQNAFGFRHLTFQEYFAGRELARMPPKPRWEKIQGNLHSNRWREPILLAVAHLGVKENRGDQATDLATRILDQNSELEPVLRRDLFMAADLAADDVFIDLSILRRIVSQLAELIQSPVPTVAEGAVSRLIRLHQLRLGESARLTEITDLLNTIVDDFSAQQLQVSQDTRAEMLALLPTLHMRIAGRLEDKDVNVRSAAVRARAGLLEGDEGLRGLVAGRLEDKDEDVRSAVVRALAGLLEGDEGLRGLVAGRLEDKDEHVNVRSAAVEALLNVVGQALRINQLLRHHDSNVRMIAIHAVELDRFSDDINRAVDNSNSLEAIQFRRAAVEALAGLLEGDEGLRGLVAGRLEDKDVNVRSAVVEALAGLLEGDEGLRGLVAGRLEDKDEDVNVRRAAVRALAGLLERGDLVSPSTDKISSDINWMLRREIIKRHVKMIALDQDLQLRIIPVLSIDDLEDSRWSNNFVYPGPKGPRNLLVHLLGKRATDDPEFRAQVVAWLNVPEWRLRLSALEIIVEVGLVAVIENKQKILASLDDHRGGDAWPARIAAAEKLINTLDFSSHAIDTLLEALDYGAHPFTIQPNSATIRRDAALALGMLKAEFRPPRVQDRLLAVIDMEHEHNVLDGAYQALLSLSAAPDDQRS